MEHYGRTQPLLASIKERYSLCKPGSSKHAFHVVIDLGTAQFPYTVGDSIGIYSQNDPALVERALRAMRLTGEEIVVSRHAQTAMAFRDYLLEKASIKDYSKKFLSEIKERQTNPEKKAHLEQLFQDNASVKAYMANYEVWDLLEAHPEVSFTAEEYAELLMPNLPRLYSIASSPLVYPQEIHLTIGLTEYETNGYTRYGVCTHYLCHLAPVGEKIIPVYLQPHKGFTLPARLDTALIMIGPGTGIAPFRAFMQERLHVRATGKHWLFFGERNAASDFFYEDEWKQLIMDDVLRLDTAFSRDQEQKIYVQHRMLEHAAEIFSWLENGACLFVCGDAEHMAKDVDAALYKILEEQGKMSHDEAKLYIKNLKLQKRYLRDVY